MFVSDIHLTESEPETINRFIFFLKNNASKHEALFILGDLFDYWIGDDADSFQEIKNLLKELSKKVKIYFIAGNRDFLIGNKFLSFCQMSLLKDPTLISLGDTLTLIMHGDTLCTDDIDYQKWRAEVRSREWIDNFLRKPLTERIEICKELRDQSETKKKNKSDLIMDVNETTVEIILQKNNYPKYLIHGHTHRPKIHDYLLESHFSQRWVLGDWHMNGNYILWEENKLQSKLLSSS
ncbi:UDP-2,3-diacylglucosamine diphosphatase [Methylophilaceae bacterium]|nr:UDP-2,3-diacylglucosamine diphosphatase [Methylophilaceae bacterium]MDC1173039.1 UDP-2,3-diacylglucosamine diphosphatase [Methylophilaceae bacterium]